MMAPVQELTLAAIGATIEPPGSDAADTRFPDRLAELAAWWGQVSGSPEPARAQWISIEPPTGEGVRLDSGFAEGNVVTPYYDPMIAKLIVSGADRAQAITRARQALRDFTIEGIKHNLPLHQRILEAQAFVDGALDTHFLEASLLLEIGECLG